MAVVEFKRASEVDFGLTGDSDSRAVTYYAKVDDISATPDQDNLVLDHAESNTPLSHDGMSRGTFDIEQVLPDTYRITANYSYSEPEPVRSTDSDAGKYEIGFSQSVERQRVLYSLETVQAFGTGAAVDDFKNAIGVQGTGDQQSIAGAEAFSPVGRRVVNFTIPNSVLTPSYEQTIENLVGKVWKPTAPATTFLGRVEGEVLFMGTRGTIQLSADFSNISFEFEVRPRIVFPNAGGTGGTTNGRTTIAGIAIPPDTVINPFDKVWVRYVPTKNANGPVEKATGVYVERIHEWGDFDELSIPGAVA